MVWTIIVLVAILILAVVLIRALIRRNNRSLTTDLSSETYEPGDAAKHVKHTIPW
jgi:NADH:ubiquinone oxidoreductase subunit 3 (subunit A)